MVALPQHIVSTHLSLGRAGRSSKEPVPTEPNVDIATSQQVPTRQQSIVGVEEEHHVEIMLQATAYMEKDATSPTKT